MHRAIKEAKGVRFTSSSLLMIYDAFKEPSQGAVVKLIDFANAEKIDQEDSNALEGINNLCKLLKDIEEM